MLVPKLGYLVAGWDFQSSFHTEGESVDFVKCEKEHLLHVSLPQTEIAISLSMLSLNK